MKAVIFARVSTKDQEDGHSLDAQIQSCFKYAIKKELKVVEQFKLVESSTASGRPEFSKMVDFVKKQGGQVAILCYCVDRL
jgi:site-specific DNA recombinase